jgi:hypothetical protein
MDATVQTPSGPIALHVCKDGDGTGTGWVEVYEQSFPSGQRQDLAQIRAQFERGTMELDETRDPEGRVLCMTLTEVFSGGGPRFLLACYTATRPELRSLGIGSIHRTKLVELLRAEYGDFLGLFSEIESTREPGLDPATRALRLRRLAFFERLGVERLPIDYRFPSYDPGAPPLHGELLWVPFGDPALDDDTLSDVLRRIYVEGYGLSADDPFIASALDEAARTLPAES